MPVAVAVPRGKSDAAAASAVFHCRRDPGCARRDRPGRRLRPQHPDAGHHLRDRGVRPLGGARTVRADQSGAGGVLRPRRLCSRHRHLGLSYQLLAVPCRRLHRGAAGRRGARRLDAAARRPLPRHGDDLVPADRHAGDDQRDLADPRPGRRLEYRPARSVPVGAILSRLLRRDAGAGRLCRLASRRYQARARDARGARQ